jgi:PmbA protein
MAISDVVASTSLPGGAELAELAQRIVATAINKGASAAECVIREGRELSATVRMGETEALKEAGGKSLGVRVFLGQRVASTYTSDFSWPAIEGMIGSAIEIARVTSEDPFAGLPEPEELGKYEGDLNTWSPAIREVNADLAIEQARRAERAALDLDPRIRNSDGGSYDASESRKILANSLGFVGESRHSHASISAVPIADENGKMQRDYWYSIAHSPAELESPEAVGRRAAERTLRRLGARKIATARVPVIFDPMTSRSIADHIFQAANGDAIFRHASFLAGMLEKPVAHVNVTVIDDGVMRGGFGSSAFDDEGVLSRRTAIIENGVLRSYLLNSYTARKLKMKTTGNAARGLAGTPGVGYGNLYVSPGRTGPADLLQSFPRAFYVTELIGMGVNMVTGDYSRGAGGLWVENGQFAYPVEEVTIAGNLKDMLKQIVAVGNDLEFRSSVAAPTLVIEGMTVAGR